MNNNSGHSKDIDKTVHSVNDSSAESTLDMDANELSVDEELEEKNLTQAIDSSEINSQLTTSVSDLTSEDALQPDWDEVISLKDSTETAQTTDPAEQDDESEENTEDNANEFSPLEDEGLSDNIEDLDTQTTPPKRANKLKEYAFVGKKAQNNASTATAEPKSRKKLWIALGALACILALAYLFGVYYYRDKFLPNTYVNGENISNMSLEEAQQTVANLSQERTIEILGKDGEKSEVKASDVGFTLTEAPDLVNVMADQNSLTWPIHLIRNFGTDLDNASTIDEQALTNVVANLDIVTGPQVVKTENARAEYNGEEFQVRKEVFGTEVDVPKLMEDIRQSLITGNPVINLEENQDYVMPVTLEDNETLAQSIDKLNSLNGTITYDFKAAQEVVDRNTYLPWLGTTETGEAMVDPAQVTSYIANLAATYDTYDKPVNFTTSSGEAIELHDYVTDGWQINQPQEVTDLTNAILAGQDVTKEPAYSKTGRDRTQPNSITGTYLEISIPDQTMWFYKDGELMVETPVVTGDPYSGHDTSEGLFEIQGKSMYQTLVGPGYASPVTFWLPFDGGIGVHDSSWRGSYGGSIYLGNGSHGCVNTPYGAVRTIYNNIEEGQPVVVY